MKIDMDLLKKLRGATFAPLKDCKDALVNANGDLEKAKDILKEKGILKAGKKADRETKEGLVKVEKKKGKVVGIKLLCETDFVAKNDTFVELIDSLMDKMFDKSSEVNSFSELNEDLQLDMNNLVAEFVGRIGENVQIGDIIVSSDNDVFVYNHPGNKITTIVYYNGGNEEFAKEVALQITAMDPTYVSIDNVPKDYYDEMLLKFVNEVKESGKPDNVIEHIAKGKMAKAMSEFVLLEQEYIRDGSRKIKDILPKDFVVKKYVRFAI